MKTNSINYQTPETHSDEVQYKFNEPLEITEEQFKPHFGNSFVFCFNNGYPSITIGPHWPLSLCLLSAIIGVTYFVTANITYHKHWFWMFSSIASGMYLATLFLMTVLKNPGIETALEKTEFQQGYCEKCLVKKVNRQFHCLDCDICIRNYDHHCPWTGKCIGGGNVFYFNHFVCAFLLYFVFNLIIALI